MTAQQIPPVASTASPPATQEPKPTAAVMIMYSAAHITSKLPATIGPAMMTMRIVDKDSSLRSRRVVTIAASSARVRLILGGTKPAKNCGPKEPRWKPPRTRAAVRFKREFRKRRTTRLSLRLHIPARRPSNLRMAQAVPCGLAKFKGAPPPVTTRGDGHASRHVARPDGHWNRSSGNYALDLASEM
jgi:hypothetical protein